MSVGHRSGWLFVSPWLAGLLLLVAYPFGASLMWSFCRYDLLTQPQFVGFQNYRQLAAEIVRGEGAGQALWNTAYFALLSVPLSIVLGVGLAVLLAQPIRGRAFYRTVFFLPSVVPTVAAAVLWMWLLDPRDGLAAQWLTRVGLPPQLWLKGTGEVLLNGRLGSKDALAMMSAWGCGNFMLIYLAALGDIPRQLYEAAELDGAGAWRRFWHVTLPQLTPVVFFNLVMGLIQSVQAFTEIYLVSEGVGAPAGSTLMLSLFVFLTAFQDLDMGYASALAWLLFVVLLAATAALFASARRWVHYRGQPG